MAFLCGSPPVWDKVLRYFRAGGNNDRNLFSSSVVITVREPIFNAEIPFSDIIMYNFEREIPSAAALSFIEYASFSSTVATFTA
jgi:hypothetical protein